MSLQTLDYLSWQSLGCSPHPRLFAHRGGRAVGRERRAKQEPHSSRDNRVRDRLQLMKLCSTPAGAEQVRTRVSRSDAAALAGRNSIGGYVPGAAPAKFPLKPCCSRRIPTSVSRSTTPRPARRRPT